MPKNRKPCLLKIEQTLTAFDMQKNLEHLVTWLNKLTHENDAKIDASTVQKIDTAGCRFIDVAITAGKKKSKQVHLEFSPMVIKALHKLGVDHGSQ